MTDPDVQTNLRLPASLKDRLVKAAASSSRSLSAEVAVRLEKSFQEPAGQSMNPALVERITAKARELGVTFEEAVEMLVSAGLDPNAPGVLIINMTSGVTMREMGEAFEFLKSKVEPASTIYAGTSPRVHSGVSFKASKR